MPDVSLIIISTQSPTLPLVCHKNAHNILYSLYYYTLLSDKQNWDHRTELCTFVCVHTEVKLQWSKVDKQSVRHYVITESCRMIINSNLNDFVTLSVRHVPSLYLAACAKASQVGECGSLSK